MSLRKVEIIIESSFIKDLDAFLVKNKISKKWWYKISEKSVKYEFIIEAENSEDILDKLDKKYLKQENTEIIISPIEALMPKKVDSEENLKTPPNTSTGLLRISRVELMHDISDYAEPSRNFIIMMIFSSVVAGIGILQDNIAIIIGAMVIAPMLGPNISLSFGTVLGDIALVKKSSKTMLLATTMALSISFFWGLLYVGSMEDIARTKINLSDIVIAFVSGAAGAVSILRSSSSSLVGVMVAVALLPPLIKSGLLAGAGQWEYSLYALLIFISNTICVILASILTFYLTKIRPKYWWEEKKAKKYTKRAIILWSFLLLLLICIVIILNY
ncbi:TIGR00341 family protein [Bacteroidota bacterium]